MDWANAIVRYYAPACAIVERAMPRRLRGVYDAEDFVCMAIAELVGNPSAIPCDGPGTLAMIAKRRMIDVLRSPRGRTAQRLPEDVAAEPQAPALAVEAEELHRSLASKATPDQQVIVDLRCQGFSTPEIAGLTGRGVRTVQRILKGFAQSHEP